MVQRLHKLLTLNNREDDLVNRLPCFLLNATPLNLTQHYLHRHCPGRTSRAGRW